VGRGVLGVELDERAGETLAREHGVAVSEVTWTKVVGECVAIELGELFGLRIEVKLGRYGWILVWQGRTMSEFSATPREMIPSGLSSR
jgi:hypothetical protein